MPGIGETLREARMRQRVTIEELEQTTKIRAKYLRALENEEFGLLPGPTYVKSFLRTYAEKLGLDPQLLVEEYRAQYEPPEPVEFQPIASSGGRDARRRPPAPRFGPGAAIGVAAVALIAFLLVLGLTSGEDDPERTVDTGPAETAQPAKPNRPRDREATVPADRVTVRVVPVDPTYVCLDDGEGTVLFEGTLDAPRTFRARDTLRINLGKRSARLFANRRPVAFENGPEPVGFEFTRSGDRRPLPEAERPCV
jgi:transcriptional regulator with XRE-family HTH domain